MRHVQQSLLWIALGAVASGCALSGDPGVDVEATCRALVASEPKDFVVRLQAVLALGPEAGKPLAAALRQRPEADGAEAALAALGRLGGDDARQLLSETVADRAPHAASAALALGECADGTAKATLLEAAEDRLADPTLRAAACASLLRLGTRGEVRRLVRALLLAGTPHGKPLEVETGLPRRPRWAYERYLLQRALLDVAGQDFGLDTDAPWDALLACADRVDAWLAP